MILSIKMKTSFEKTGNMENWAQKGSSTSLENSRSSNLAWSKGSRLESYQETTYCKFYIRYL